MIKNLIPYLFFLSVITAQDIVNVTFVANTSGVPDLISDHSQVHIRGGHIKLGYWTVSTPAKMESSGGDYWKHTVSFDRSELQAPIQYKYVTNRLPEHIVENNWGGWEAGGNRILDLSNYAGNDTTLPLEYVRGWKGSSTGQPLFTETDSIEILIRVNMELEIKSGQFFEGFDRVGIKGSRIDGASVDDLSYSDITYLEKENDHENGLINSVDYSGGNFYSGVIRVPASWAGFQINYKFIKFSIFNNTETWEELGFDTPFRTATLPAQGDTTIAWVRWNNKNVVEPGSIIHISEYGDDYFADGSIDNPFYRIEWAAFNANDGDTLLLKPGFYYDNISLENKSLIITSNYLYSNSDSDISQTVINGDFNSSIIKVFNTGSNLTKISGLTLLNGLDTLGGAIYAENSKLELENIKIKNSSASFGGALYIENSSDLKINNCTIENNHADSSAGGLYLLDVRNFLFDNLTVASNTSDHQGGGVHSIRSNGLLVNSLINQNHSSKGGGLSLYDRSDIKISNTEISYNSASHTGTAGGGILSLNSNLELFEVKIHNNESLNGWAGGVNFTNPGEEGSSLLNIISSEIFNNISYKGGGLNIWNFSNNTPADTIFTKIFNTKIRKNTATYYAGLYAGGDKIFIELDSCIVDSNESKHYNSGVSVENRSMLEIKRSLVLNNISNTEINETYFGSGVSVFNEGVLHIIKSNIVNNKGSQISGLYVEDGTAFVNTSLITHNENYQTGILKKAGNPDLTIKYSGLFPVDSAFLPNEPIMTNMDSFGLIIGDPLFVDVHNNDLKLTFSTPMTDKGDPDLDNDGVSWENDIDDQDPDGSRFDIGLYPLYESAVVVGLESDLESGSLIGPMDPISFTFTESVFTGNLDELLYVFNKDGDTLDVNIESSGLNVLINPSNTSFTTRDSIFVQFHPGITDLKGSIVKYNGMSGIVEYPYFVAGPGDFNKDGALDIYDFSLLASEWGQQNSNLELYPYGGDIESQKINISGDNSINYDDLLIFLYVWNLENNISAKSISIDQNLSTQYLNISLNERNELTILPNQNIEAYEILFISNGREISLINSTNIFNEGWLEIISKSDDHKKLKIDRAGTNNTEPPSPIRLNFKGDALYLEISGVLKNGSRFNEKGRVKISEIAVLPIKFGLHQNYPNPFNPSTLIPISIAETKKVFLSIYDINGRLVSTLVDKTLLPGKYNILWNGRNDQGQRVAAGIYICRLESGDFTSSRKLMLIK